MLEIRLLRDHKNKVLALSQATYIEKILKRFNVENSKKNSYLSDMKFSSPKNSVQI